MELSCRLRMENELEFHVFPIFPTITLPDKPNATQPTVTAEGQTIIFTTYEIILPIVASIGIMGNVSAIVILFWFKFNNRFVFAYMKGLAITDLGYLLFTMQSAYLVSDHLFLALEYRNPESRALAIYVWNIFSPLWNILGSASDSIITLMTIDRYKTLTQVMKKPCALSKVRRSEEKILSPKVLVLMAIVLCTLFHLPYCFQFQIVPCNGFDSNLNFNETLADPGNTACWSPIPSYFSQTKLWVIFCILNVLAMKLIPYAVVTSLNIIILVKLRYMWKSTQSPKVEPSSHKTSSGTKDSGVETKGGSSHHEDRPTNALNTPTSLGIYLQPEPTTSINLDSRGHHETWRSHDQQQSGRQKMNKETRLTIQLVTVVFCHVILTLPQNVTYVLWTLFPATWNGIENRILLESISDVMCGMNYSINFFLYCLTNRDIRFCLRRIRRCNWKLE